MSTTVPAGFKVSKTIRDELPEAEREKAAAELWGKSKGVCALCDEPLPADGKGIDVDHRIARAEADGGSTRLSNLYLAHKSCNRSRLNLPFPLAIQIIRFQKWHAGHTRRSFEDVVKKYVPKGNQRVRIVSITDDEIVLAFGQKESRANVYVDPATSTRYFFMNAPVQYVMNDRESQPRVIEADHVRTLAVDFSVHPVHEPSNCRVVPTTGDTAELLQFDGQHKTTAQIVLGRDEVPMKFYYDPSEPMIQELVVQIQQGIKKRPLSTTDTLRKLDDVIQNKVEEYKASHEGRAPTEQELVAAQPKQDQKAFKARLLKNFEWVVMDDDRLKLRDYVSKGKASRDFPLTDTVLVTKLIRPLIAQELLDEPLDDAKQRDTERDAIVSFLNQICDRMLTDTWKPLPSTQSEDLHTSRARTFFYQGAISWWLKEILLPAIQMHKAKAEWERLFLTPFDPDQDERISAYIEALSSWPIWSTSDEDELAAFRSNTLSRVIAQFPDYNQIRLVKDSQN
jgi:hypothetical protein